MSARAWWKLKAAAVAMAAVGLLAGCPMGLGERCASNDECRNDLVCSMPSGATVGLCDYALRGAGEPCVTASQCQTSLTCSSHFFAGERYGVCADRQPDGQPCSVARDCASGRCTGATPELLGTCNP